MHEGLDMSVHVQVSELTCLVCELLGLRDRHAWPARRDQLWSRSYVASWHACIPLSALEDLIRHGTVKRVVDGQQLFHDSASGGLRSGSATFGCFMVCAEREGHHEVAWVAGIVASG